MVLLLQAEENKNIKTPSRIRCLFDLPDKAVTKTKIRSNTSGSSDSEFFKSRQDLCGRYAKFW